jgi:DUF4097 and DUF4098 domain-containing protein YvlB
VPEFPTPDGARLHVRNPSGLVSVETAETAETTVELVALRDDEGTREAIERATVEARGNLVTVEIGKQGWGFLGRSPEIAVRIRTPYGARLECSTASADVTVTGRAGTSEVSTASGDVRFDHVEGDLAVQSASGDIRVDQVDRDARLQSVSGDLRVGRVGGDLNANTVSGDLQLGQAEADVSAKTVSGDQEIASVAAGEIKLQSVSGDVEVGVRAGTKVFIDASSTSGDVGSDLDVTDAPRSGSGGPEAKLRIRTVSGDVSIRRGS